MKNHLLHFSLFSSIILIAVIMMMSVGCGREDSTVTDRYLLPGRFSVAEGKQVRFTRGNLYWDGSAYHFESCQTDFAGSSGRMAYDAAHVSHFFWTNNTDYQSGNAAYMPYAAAYSFSNGQADDKRSIGDKFFCDGDNKITVDGQSNLYVLTGGFDGEWAYLFQKRTDALSLYKKHVTVNGVPECLVIAPDDFTGTLAESYDSSAWKAAEASGLVCLPPAGYRSGTDLYSQGTGGGYWSATPSNDDANVAYGVYFPDPNVFPADYGSRSYGYSIRLVSSVSN